LGIVVGSILDNLNVQCLCFVLFQSWRELLLLNSRIYFGGLVVLMLRI